MALTTLEGSDTPGKVAFLCRKAMQPLHPRYEVPNCAAVCVYPNLVRIAKKFLARSTVKIASIATGFRAGFDAGKLKLQEVRNAVLSKPSPGPLWRSELALGEIGASIEIKQDKANSKKRPHQRAQQAADDGTAD